MNDFEASDFFILMLGSFLKVSATLVGQRNTFDHFEFPASEYISPFFQKLKLLISLPHSYFDNFFSLIQKITTNFSFPNVPGLPENCEKLCVVGIGFGTLGWNRASVQRTE